MELYLVILFILFTNGDIFCHGDGVDDKLSFTIDTSMSNSGLKCNQDSLNQNVWKCPHERPHPWRRVLSSPLEFNEKVCNYEIARNKRYGTRKCEAEFEGCFKDFDLDYNALNSTEFTISMFLNISINRDNTMRIFEWRDLVMEIVPSRNVSTFKVTDNEFTSSSSWGSSHHVLILGYASGELCVEEMYLDGKKLTGALKCRSSGKDATGLERKHMGSKRIRFGCRLCNSNITDDSPFMGTIMLFDIFSYKLNQSERQTEKTFNQNFQKKLPYPECICADGELGDGNLQCKKGFSRLTGKNSSEESYFVPVTAVADGILNESRSYGFTLINSTDLYIDLDETSLIKKFEVIMNEQELSITYRPSKEGVEAEFISTNGFSDKMYSLVPEPWENGLLKKYTWTWDENVAPFLVKGFHLNFGNIQLDPLNNCTNMKRVYEVIIIGRPLYPIKTYGHCSNCESERDICRAEKTILSGYILEPNITHLQPKNAYLSGKTTITIHGVNLKPFSSGVVAQVSIGTNKCNVKNFTNSSIMCTTEDKSEMETGMTNVTVHIKLRNYDLPESPLILQLNITEDPVIRNISIYKAMFGVPFNMMIHGENFGGLKQIDLTITYRVPVVNNKFNKTCILMSDTLIACNGSIKEHKNLVNTDKTRVNLGFHMDGISKFRNLTAAMPELDPFFIYQRPIITSNEIKLSEESLTLIFKGNYLHNCEHYIITVGTLSCESLNVTPTAITCSLSKASGWEGPYAPTVKGCGTLYAGMEEDFRGGMINVPGIICGIFVPLCFMLVVLVCIWKRRDQRKAQEVKNILLHRLYQGNYTQISEADRLFDTLRDDLRHILKRYLIDRKRLHIRKEIGKGYYGKVYLGYLNQATGDQIVAVKTLRSDHRVSALELTEFLEEATVMKDFVHTNVLTLLGIVVDRERVFIILPYMKNGDLRTHVTRKMFNFKRFTGYVWDVARGMDYLSQQEFVHCDLSARSCMVDATERVLIADLGLVRDLAEADHCSSSKTMNHIPWIALECLQGWKFTTQSDVWSYGVLMWEVYSRGAKPYEGLNDAQLRAYLKRGGRLNRPPGCPQILYELFLQCWDRLPNHRPKFSDILVVLDQILENYGGSSNMAESCDSLDPTSVRGELFRRAGMKDLSSMLSLLSRDSSETSSCPEDKEGVTVEADKTTETSDEELGAVARLKEFERVTLQGRSKNAMKLAEIV